MNKYFYRSCRSLIIGAWELEPVFFSGDMKSFGAFCCTTTRCALEGFLNTGCFYDILHRHMKGGFEKDRLDLPSVCVYVAWQVTNWRRQSGFLSC